MILPKDLFLNSITPGKVFYFQTDKIQTDIPHYFICLSKTESQIVILACCTSRFEKRKKFIESRNLPSSTLVWLKPTDDNGFRKDTYVDCNNAHNFDIERLNELHQKGKLDISGEINSSDFSQIIIGFKESPMIELSIKKTLPEID